MKQLPIPNKSAKYQITTELSILNLAQMRLIGTLEYLKYNRGVNGIDIHRARRYADSFDVNSLGTAYLFYNTDTSEGQPAGWTLLDFHHRLAAIIMVYQEGKLTAEDANAMVTVKLVPEDMWLKTYLRLNAGKGHTGGQLITCRHTDLGKFTYSFSEKTGLPHKGSLSQNILDIGLAIESCGYGNVSVEDIYLQRANSNLLLNKVGEKKGSPVSPQVEDYLVHAGIKTVAIQNALRRKIKERGFDSSSDAAKIAECPGFILTVMADYVGPKAFVNKPAGALADKILEAPSKMLLMFKTVSRRNKKELKLGQAVELLSKAKDKIKNKATQHES